MQVTPKAKDIVQGSQNPKRTSGERVSLLAMLQSVDMTKPSTDFELGVRDGKRAALTEFTEGNGDFPLAAADYEKYEEGRKFARQAVGSLLGLTPEKEFPVVATKGKK